MRNPTEELEDKLTELDPPYESLEELQIGRMLDQYGIPFFYRQPTVVYHQGQNEIWQPSFTLSSYGGLVVDYVADSQQPHVPDALTREQIYADNQIPAVVLAPPDLDKANWDQQLYERLQRACREIADPTRYEPVGTQK